MIAKIFSQINKKSILDIIIFRLKLCKKVDDIIIACSTNKKDIQILNYCKIGQSLVKERGPIFGHN